MKINEDIPFYIGLIIVSLLFLLIEHFIHSEFLLHMAAIPLEILTAVFVIEKLLKKRELQKKRRQLMLIKSYLFRSELKNLYIFNFRALRYPSISMSRIKKSNLCELKKMREDVNTSEYKSSEMIECVIIEYVKVKHIWENFLERAINYDFENIFHDMIYILHFLCDFEYFKNNNPNKLFIYEAEKETFLMKKVMKVLRDGIKKFLDYAIELKEKQPELFDELLLEYESTDKRTENEEWVEKALKEL